MEKNGISLFAFVIIAAIIIITIILVVVVLNNSSYINKTENKMEESIISKDVENNEELNEVINSFSKGIKFENLLDNEKNEGTKFAIVENKELDITDTFLGADMIFHKDGSFLLYMTFGNYVSGNYEFKNNNYTCTIKEFEGEFSPVQKVSGKIVFEKVDDSTMKVLEASESIMIKTTEKTDSRMGSNRK